LASFQRVVFGIAMRWRWLLAAAFCVCAIAFSVGLWFRGSQSVKRYEAKTALLFTPKKIAHIDAMGDRQLMTVLERPSLKRRVAERVQMDQAESMCLTVDMSIEQGRRQGNLFSLTAASKTYEGAVAKANAYADILIDEYVAFRSKDLDIWRVSLEDRRKGLVDKLADVEAEEAAFKVRSGALTPNEALIALNALISDQRRNDSALGVDAANEEIKKRKLETSVGTSGAAITANALAIRRRVAAIDAIDAELATLREKYTDINPRVSGKMQERSERVAELGEFLKSKGIAGLEIDKIDQVEKAAADLSECETRLEAIAEKRLALSREIADNEKRAAELATTVMDYERIVARREDLVASIRNSDEQLGGISYAIGSLMNDLRQIERAKGSSDSGPFGAKRAVMALGGAFAVSGALLFLVLLFELMFGMVRGGREIAAYDGIAFLGSLPKTGVLSEDEEREALGVVALKLMLAAKDKGCRTLFVCRLPGVVKHDAFAMAIDFTASMSGTRCFCLDVVTQDGFTPPDGAEEMIATVRSGSRGWFGVANRFAMAPTEIEMLKADMSTLGESFDIVFVRAEDGLRVGGTFFDQLLELSDATILMVGDGTTTRHAFAYARHHLGSSGEKTAGKPVFAIAVGSGVKQVRAEMEVLS